MQDSELADRYGRNFSIRFSTSEREQLYLHASENKVRPSTLIREVLQAYYKSKVAAREVALVKATDADKLPMLIILMTTDEGRAALQTKMLKTM